MVSVTGATGVTLSLHSVGRPPLRVLSIQSTSANSDLVNGACSGGPEPLAPVAMIGDQELGEFTVSLLPEVSLCIVCLLLTVLFH